MARVVFVMVLIVSVLAVLLQATREPPRFNKYNNLTIKEMHQACMKLAPGVTLEEIAEIFGNPRPPQGGFAHYNQMDFRVFSPPEYAEKYKQNIVVDINIDTREVLSVQCSDKKSAF